MDTDFERETGAGIHNTVAVNATHGPECSYINVHVPICMSKI